jgi:hypothetical protein
VVPGATLVRGRGGDVGGLAAVLIAVHVASRLPKSRSRLEPVRSPAESALIKIAVAELHVEHATFSHGSGCRFNRDSPKT